jgi:uncharacterized membrane protein
VKTDGKLLALSLVSLVGTAVAYPFLPEAIPLHWNAMGDIDSWGPRLNVFWMGALPLLILALLHYLPALDPRRDSYAKHEKAYGAFKAITVLFLVAVAWIDVAVSLGARLDVSALVRLGTGILFIVLGNYLGQIRPNYFVGIRTPWTLANGEVWRRTHRRGGYVFIAMGLVFIASLALPTGSILVAVDFGAVFAGIAYLVAYSYVEFRRVTRQKGE